MATIALENMRFFAFHGVHPEEKLLGCDYIIDIFIQAKIDDAAKKDDVSKTINYEIVYRICDAEMRKNSKLIETVATRIINQLKRQFADLQGARIKIQKLNPPLGGRVGASSIEIEENYVETCAKCGKNKFSCYKTEDCWCKSLKIHPATMERIQGEYKKKCLCKDCLKTYVG